MTHDTDQAAARDVIAYVRDVEYPYTLGNQQADAILAALDAANLTIVAKVDSPPSEALVPGGHVHLWTDHCNGLWTCPCGARAELINGASGTIVRAESGLGEGEGTDDAQGRIEVTITEEL